MVWTYHECKENSHIIYRNGKVIFYISYEYIWNESVNIDGQHFHQYQQNEQSLFS